MLNSFGIGIIFLSFFVHHFLFFVIVNAVVNMFLFCFVCFSVLHFTFYGKTINKNYKKEESLCLCRTPGCESGLNMRGESRANKGRDPLFLSHSGVFKEGE